MPDPINRITCVNAPFQTDEHVTDIVPFHPPGEKSDILLAHRSKVEHLSGRMAVKTFYEKLQDIAGIIDRFNPMARILPRPV
jgi:hypothetical protein